MQIEENLLPADDLRSHRAGNDFNEIPQPQESGVRASQSRSEDWSAFAPACDILEDVLLIPGEQHTAAAPNVEAEVLEDVFGGVEAVVVASPSTAGGLELQSITRASTEEQSALHTSLMPCESSSNDTALPPVESFRGPAPVYDKYAVGMRILRISPVWLLLSAVGFISIILLFSWMFRPDGNAGAAAFDTTLKNEATNQSPLAAPVAIPAAIPAAIVPEVAPVAEHVAQPAPAPQPEAAAVEPVGHYTVQVGSYNDASQANERVSALRSSGVEARAAAVEIPKRGTWHRVYAGRFQTRQEATHFGAQLRARGAADNVIVAEVEER
jgi:hypothetical protein